MCCVILNKDGVEYFFYSRLINEDLLSVIHAIKAVFTKNDLETELQNGILNPNNRSYTHSYGS